MKKVEVKGIKNKELNETAKSLIKQKPNKRLFGTYRFYLRAYNYGSRGNDSSKYRRFFREKIGEPPVIMDTAKLNESARQIKAYLFNNGYWSASVSYTVAVKRKQGKITFNVDMGAPYYVRAVKYNISDRELYGVIMGDTVNSKIKPGQIFNADIISQERDRITEKLRNEGYYYFSKEYISFTVDTGRQNHNLNINLTIRNPDAFQRHRPYRISSIYINVQNPNEDSTRIIPLWYMKDSIWINLNGYKIKDDVLLRSVIMKPGGLFRQKEVDNTYSRFNGLEIFSQTNINIEKDSIDGYLVVRIDILPGKKQEATVEPQLITSEQTNAIVNNTRNYGTANVFQYRNKNLLHGGEVFELRQRSSVESQLRSNDSIPFFSNIEHSITGTLYFSKLLVFSHLQKSLEFRNVRAALNTNFIYESNIDFTRRVLAVGYSEILTRVFNTFNISWMEISYNQTNAKRNFLSRVNPADSIFVANLFSTNLITSSRVVWNYSDKEISKNGSFFNSRTLIELAGNTLYGFMRATNQPLPLDGIYKVNNVNFEQFVKLDGDVRYLNVLNERNSMAYRLHLGVGIPYGNSTVMPFVRRYFIGGANSLRGWRPRTLGPGSYYNPEPTVRVDRSGEMIIESQMEYRFNLIRKLLNGALFLDAGNIWYTKPVPGKDGVSFGLGTFLGQMAVNTGMGFRFDFDFLVIRLDLGLPLRNPEKAKNDRWLFDDYYSAKKVFTALVFNLGVGYPF